MLSSSSGSAFVIVRRSSNVRLKLVVRENVSNVLPRIPGAVQRHCAELAVEWSRSRTLHIHVDAGASNAATLEPLGQTAQECPGHPAPSESGCDVQILYFARTSMPRRRVPCDVADHLALGERDKRRSRRERPLRVVRPI